MTQEQREVVKSINSLYEPFYESAISIPNFDPNKLSSVMEILREQELKLNCVKRELETIKNHIHSNPNYSWVDSVLLSMVEASIGVIESN